MAVLLSIIQHQALVIIPISVSSMPPSNPTAKSAVVDSRTFLALLYAPVLDSWLDLGWMETREETEMPWNSALG